jgi:hypothetical protein
MTDDNVKALDVGVQLLLDHVARIEPAIDKLTATVRELGDKAHKANNLLQVWAGEMVDLNRELGEMNKRLELVHGRIGTMLDRMADAMREHDVESQTP